MLGFACRRIRASRAISRRTRWDGFSTCDETDRREAARTRCARVGPAARRVRLVGPQQRPAGPPAPSELESEPGYRRALAVDLKRALRCRLRGLVPRAD